MLTHASREAQVGWAAGLFEGEGSITVTNDTVTVRLNNTDESVVDRFWQIVDRGIVYGPYRNRSRDGFKRKPFWVWVAQGFNALDVLALLGPWLSERRLARAYELTGIHFHVFYSDRSESG